MDMGNKKLRGRDSVSPGTQRKKRKKQEMDARLFEAAQTGNRALLYQLLTDNPLILDSSSLFLSLDPLHVSSVSGEIDFCKEILWPKPEFASELDPDGFSHLHMAAAAGQVAIAKELMMLDPKLCRLEGRGKKTPLHCAAVKGKADVIQEMVLSCAECFEDVTVQRESALHLALKNNQFEAVRVILGLMREKEEEDLLNMKDEQGNTALHLTTWRKQHQMIDLLLAKEGTRSEHLEVNAINKSGLTDLDLLLIFPSEAGDREIEEILRKSGAVRARDFDNSTTHPFLHASSNLNQQICAQRGEDLIEYFKFKKETDSPNEVRTALLVVSWLVATATFQAGLSPPGGTWQENYYPDKSTGDQKKYLAGWFVMGTLSGKSLLFVLFN